MLERSTPEPPNFPTTNASRNPHTAGALKGPNPGSPGWSET
jgi:hypothetical protein